MQMICCVHVGLFYPINLSGLKNNLTQECLLDLQVLPAFILNNDAGGKDIFQKLYFSAAINVGL